MKERNVVFSFFSGKVILKEKNEMLRKLLKLKIGTDQAIIDASLMQMFEIGEITHLKDLIGRDFLHFFELLPLANFFPRELPKVWVGTKITKLFKNVWKKYNLAERTLGMATSVRNFGDRVVRSVVFATAMIARLMVQLPPKPRCCVLGYDASR